MKTNIPKRGNRVLYIPLNMEEVDNIDFLSKYMDKLYKKALSKGWDLKSMCCELSYAHIYKSVIELEKLIHKNNIFDTRFIYRDLMTHENIKWKSVLKNIK